jgi:hypothetical protein
MMALSLSTTTPHAGFLPLPSLLKVPFGNIIARYTIIPIPPLATPHVLAYIPLATYSLLSLKVPGSVKAIVKTPPRLYVVPSPYF